MFCNFKGINYFKNYGQKGISLKRYIFKKVYLDRVTLQLTFRILTYLYKFTIQRRHFDYLILVKLPISGDYYPILTGDRNMNYANR